MEGVKHEFDHLLFGGNHPFYSNYPCDGYAKNGISGILASQGNVALGWEREKLGWKNYIDITSNQTFSLRDYATTGQVLRIAIPGTDESFLVQNHQKLSIYDDPNTDRPGKGLFIYHVSGMSNQHPTYDVETTEGKYNWTVPYYFDPGPGWGD